ncbi:MAG: serine/threonine-protein kinase [Ferruginibacter sp.]
MGYADEEITEVAGYRLAKKIGSGGMGNVYKAFNPAINRTAAVKILNEASFAERFKNEAYIQSSINHPNIALLYEYAKCNNRLCIVMEFVEGETLSDILHRKGKLTSQETENILLQIISALTYLHKKEIIHRDIKPQNFKITADGTVKMLDFGIAKNKYSPKLTQLGFVIGTMEYLAPEQFEQKEEMKSDIWCLSVMLYELLTGFMPFEATNPALMRTKIVKGSFTNPKILVPVISDKMATIIERGLKVNPASRISAAEIGKLLNDNNVSRSETKLNRLPVKITSKKNLLIAASAIAAFLLIIFMVNRKPAIPSVQPQKEIITTGIEPEKVSINVPGINNAVLITGDNTKLLLPYTVKGKDGDKFQFTIRAEGYEDKKIEVLISPRRSSYDYNLEKIKN